VVADVLETPGQRAVQEVGDRVVAVPGGSSRGTGQVQGDLGHRRRHPVQRGGRLPDAKRPELIGPVHRPVVEQ